MTSIVRIAALSAVAITALVGSIPASAQSRGSGNFYAGKTIKIIVTTGAGGGYDLIARTVGRHLPKYLSGTPSVIVQNMPGAGSVKGTNYIYNVTAKDSTVIGAVGNQVAFAPLLGITQAQFDPTKLHWLGSPTSEVGLLLVWHEVPVDSIEDAKKREVITATSGGGSTSAFYARVFNDVFGTKLRILTGYDGMNGAFLAMERGEVHAFPSAFWSSLKATKPDWVRDKKVKYLLQYGTRKAHPELPNVPIARQVATSEEDRRLLDVAMAPLELGRPFVMPPQVPLEHVQLMRPAMIKTFGDKGFVAEAKKQGLEMGEPRTGEEIEALIQETYSAPKAVIERLREIYAAGKKKKKK